MPKTTSKRLLSIGFMFMVISFALIARLGFIQIVKHGEYMQRAVSQRMIRIPISANRGEILDRNQIPFTDRDYQNIIIAYPYFISNKSNTSDIISKATGIDKVKVFAKLQPSTDIVEFEAKSENEYISRIKNGKVQGVLSVERLERYSKNGLARHIIGKIDSSNKGESGLEKKFDDLLRGDGSDSVVAVVDSGKNVIPGLGIRRVQSNNDNIILTMDYHIQKILEETLDSEKINGSMVVMDIKNGSILGMASKPDFLQSNSQSLSSANQNYLNKAINSYNLGSIFKIIVAAAAIENKKIDFLETYKCEGEIVIGDNTVKCSTYETHKSRNIDINEAFSLSCNTTFINIGMKTGSKNIIEMAEKFGFGKTQAVIRENKESINVLSESEGQLPNVEDGISNISIGQGSLLATPLQITSAIATIANDGIKYKPRLIDSIVSGDGITLKKFNIEQPEVIISPSTARALKAMMRQVTVSGTGTRANMDDLGGSSGKTGTAEAGAYTHAWFAGFVPSNEPKYAITVFIHDGRSGGAHAAPVFRQVATKLLNLYSK